MHALAFLIPYRDIESLVKFGAWFYTENLLELSLDLCEGYRKFSSNWRIVLDSKQKVTRIWNYHLSYVMY